MYIIILWLFILYICDAQQVTILVNYYGLVVH